MKIFSYDRTHKRDFALYRAYDPDLGRWLNEDPIRLEDGPNLFAYVGDNPIRRFDPFGLQQIACKFCDQELAEKARIAIKKVCHAVSGSEDCRSKMAQIKGMAQLSIGHLRLRASLLKAAQGLPIVQRVSG